MTDSAAGGCGDSRFGPFILTSDCRGGFDFTILFESSILNVLPAACFLVLVLARLYYLSKQSVKVSSSIFHRITLGTSIAYAAIQVALVVLVTKQHQGEAESVVLIGVILDLVAALGMTALIDLEHFRSVRPSFLVFAYLFLTTLFDLARLRTAWLVEDNHVYSACLSASFALKLILLVITNTEKRKWLIGNEKDHSIESVSGPLSRGLLTWLNGLLWKGHSKLLPGDGLPAIHEKLMSADLSERFTSTWGSRNQKSSNALLWAVLKCLRWEMAAIAFPRLCVVGFSIAQPFLIGRLVTVLQETTASSEQMGYGLIAATAIVFTGIAIFRASYEQLGYRATTMLRGGLMTIVFQHMMHLPLGGTDESSAMALLGSDIEMLAEYFYSVVCETWANVLQLAMATCLLQTQVGIVCIAPILVATTFIASSFLMGNAVSTRQKSWLQTTEKRITFTTAILGSIRNVKFLGLSGVMRSMVEELRTKELESSKKFRHLQSIRVCMGQLVTLAAYAIWALLQGSASLAVSQAVSSLSLISLMITPLSELLMAIPDTYSSIGCLNRIQDFLKSPRHPEKRRFPQPSTSSSLSSDTASGIELRQMAQTSRRDEETVLSLRDVRFGWKSSSISDTPSITLDFISSDTGTLVMLVGPVGCGKSTFLKGLAGETPVLEGELFITYPDIAFCDESAWLSNASIRSNIIGEDAFEFDSIWYRTVVSACALDPDLKRMAAGDETVVGSKGSKLSGGQRQRIAIARAVYARRRIACFDGVFSGLDNATTRHVFDNVFGFNGLLRRLGCTVFFATHNMHHLSEADMILMFGGNGGIAKIGRFADLRDDLGQFTLQHDVEVTDDHKTQATDEKSLPTGEIEEPASNAVADSGLQTTDRAVYKYYFSALGWLRISVLLFFLVTNAGINAFRYVWVDLWASSRNNTSNSQVGYWLGLYGLFSVVEIGSLMAAVFWTYVVIVPAASKNLHSVILSACMSAPYSFLSNIDTGALVTRFSQDMRLVDMVLPRGFISTGFQLFAAIAQCATAVASLPYLAATLPFLIGVLYLVQRFYLKTSRQLRLLEIELKTPLYTHFIETLAGITTIRAFSWRDATSIRMISMLDTAQRPYYLLLCIQRWLGLVLNLIAAAIAVLLVGTATSLRTRVQPGLLGIALVMMTDLGLVLSSLVQNYTLLETSLGSISRIKEFAETTPNEENELLALEDLESSKEWLTRGEIEFADTSISWSDSAAKPPLVNGINIHIGAGEKLGLCGRTGSGKSTLALSLLRLNEIASGQILIDGHDIAQKSRSSVRERISCLSQEPFIFPGTIRQNADPLHQTSDAQIIDALRAVGVWDSLVIGSSGVDAEQATEEECLGSTLDENVLSQGQKQLFCLARALLKKSKILILDEPTSSLDHETDAKVQRIIRESFQGCTVIMVAHRIHSLLDFDQVGVLNSGRLVEFGHPRQLVDRSGSEFAKLLSLES
ncbi:Uncharacterized protein PECH_000838 [Penicillium ucsense]|uniref:Uncharacterized protein n=1 Tax=Penicillium ucsense TaxID=2839758 RepID=A0A8J8VZV5_9EURO|nr:Uncharacterized protein PECM_000523 [Penicillium ucsense]KAF7733334.1 Uncharacterized protein PECH_000838 [Penicillium ucsense]